MTSAVEIHLSAAHARESELLAACHIDGPRIGEHSDFFGIRVMGWALGMEEPVIAVEIRDGKNVIHRISMNVARPDVAAGWPDKHWAEQCGFDTVAGLLWVPLDFSLSVQAIFANGRREEIGTIAGRRQPARSSREPKLQPLMITTLGRTGSTWVTWLFAQHPQITAYRPFLFEPRVLSYWTEILSRTAAPASALQSVFATDLLRRSWWLTSEPDSQPSFGPLDPGIIHCLARANVDALSELCVSRIDDFYLRTAQLHGKTAPAFFAEKLMPRMSRDLAWELYPGAREIVLVRDFRDMVASIIAFNAKRKFLGFGREKFESDEDYITGCLLPDALDLLAAWKNRKAHTCLVRYEDIILKPRETLATTLAHLGLDAGDATIAAMIEHAANLVPEAEHHRTIADPARSVGRWRTDLPPQLREFCTRVFAHVLREFGYECD